MRTRRRSHWLAAALALPVWTSSWDHHWRAFCAGTHDLGVLNVFLAVARSQCWGTKKGLQKACPRSAATVLEPIQLESSSRFCKLLSSLTCTEAELACVDGARTRMILRGLAAISRSETVTQAFGILYEDLAPVRLACDLLCWRLQRPVAEAARSASHLAAELAPSVAELSMARQLFEVLDSDGSGTVERDELLSNGLLRSLGQCDGCTCQSQLTCRSVDRFMQEVDADGDGSITFLEFMLAASRILFSKKSSLRAGPEVVESLLSPRESVEISEAELASRFQDILVTVKSWEGSAASKEVLSSGSRLSHVLAGLFAGAHLPELTDALEAMYVDYLPLRIGGDLVFKMMRKLVEDTEDQSKP